MACYSFRILAAKKEIPRNAVGAADFGEMKFETSWQKYEISLKDKSK